MRLVHYDSCYNDPYQAGALSALGAYIDHVYNEQGAVVPIGAASFASNVHISPGQPGDVSCGVSALVEIQRIVDD